MSTNDKLYRKEDIVIKKPRRTNWNRKAKKTTSITPKKNYAEV